MHGHEIKLSAAPLHKMQMMADLLLLLLLFWPQSAVNFWYVSCKLDYRAPPAENFLEFQCHLIETLNANRLPHRRN